MARNNSYTSEEYRRIQAEKTRISWLLGLHNHQRTTLIERKCKRRECHVYFQLKSYDPKIFCSQNCAATYNNISRGPLTFEWRKKISESVKREAHKYPNKNKGKIFIPRLVKNCLYCGTRFETERWRNKKYCDGLCSIKDIGSRSTSPKASKGKNGIRLDISPDLNFYSRWEANFARILELLKMKWSFQPRRFDLDGHYYTPDFYLPEFDTYIEIKNFLSKYSEERDRKFRELYPQIKLLLITKKEYNILQDSFSSLVKNWEFS